MQLYGYFRSSASYRVRIALGLKGLSAEAVAVNLVAGEQHEAAYGAVNAQMLVPTLKLDDGTCLTQSLAIMEYLDECHPCPALLPAEARDRARVRALAQIIACDTAPLGNSGTLRYLSGALGVNEAQKMAWLQHWIMKGLTAFEAMLPGGGPFCYGDAPGLADCCLVPQLYNARRFGCALDAVPRIVAIDAACAELEAFKAAHPSQQVDAQGA